MRASHHRPPAIFGSRAGSQIGNGYLCLQASYAARADSASADSLRGTWCTHNPGPLSKDVRKRIQWRDYLRVPSSRAGAYVGGHSLSAWERICIIDVITPHSSITLVLWIKYGGML